MTKLNRITLMQMLELAEHNETMRDALEHALQIYILLGEPNTPIVVDKRISVQEWKKYIKHQ